MYSPLLLTFYLSTARAISPGSTLENIAPMPLFSLFTSFGYLMITVDFQLAHHFVLCNQGSAQARLNIYHECLRPCTKDFSWFCMYLTYGMTLAQYS